MHHPRAEREKRSALEENRDLAACNGRLEAELRTLRLQAGASREAAQMVAPLRQHNVKLAQQLTQLGADNTRLSSTVSAVQLRCHILQRFGDRSAGIFGLRL